MNHRNESLRKSLAKRRDHGIRKQYNGRASTTRYDSTPATFIEIHNKPMRLWVDDEACEYRGGGAEDGAVTLGYKPSADKDRRDVEMDTPYAFVDADENEYVVRFFRIDGKGKGTARRATCVVKQRTQNGLVVFHITK